MSRYEFEPSDFGKLDIGYGPNIEDVCRLANAKIAPLVQALEEAEKIMREYQWMMPDGNTVTIHGRFNCSGQWRQPISPANKWLSRHAKELENENNRIK